MKNSKGNQNITYTIVHYPFLWRIRIKVWGNQSLSRNTRRGSEVLISSVEGRAVGLSLPFFAILCELTTFRISLWFLQFLIVKPNVLIRRLNPVQISNSTGVAMRDRIFDKDFFQCFERSGGRHVTHAFLKTQKITAIPQAAVIWRVFKHSNKLITML